MKTDYLKRDTISKEKKSLQSPCRDISVSGQATESVGGLEARSTEHQTLSDRALVWVSLDLWPRIVSLGKRKRVRNGKAY